jgi:hypothetical protein
MVLARWKEYRFLLEKSSCMRGPNTWLVRAERCGDSSPSFRWPSGAIGEKFARYFRWVVGRSMNGCNIFSDEMKFPFWLYWAECRRLYGSVPQLLWITLWTSSSLVTKWLIRRELRADCLKSRHCGPQNGPPTFCGLTGISAVLLLAVGFFSRLIDFMLEAVV